MDTTLVDIVTKLKVISCVREHERFSTNNNLIKIEPNSKLSPLYRWLFGEDREANMMALQTIFDAAIHDHAIIFKELNQAKQGRARIQITYGDDKTAVCKLQCMIDILDRVLREDEEHREAHQTISQSAGGKAGKGGSKGRRSSPSSS